MNPSFERTLIEHCAPTLMNKKPANLFRYVPAPGEDIRRMADVWNLRLAGYGISVMILKQCRKSGAVLVYVFREKWLSRIIRDRRIRGFLGKEGYREDAGTAELLLKLSERLCVEEQFPHEIGIFLGYPLEDVIGFIENKGENYTYCGYWKSYGDPKLAMARADCYIDCMRSCLEQYEKGIPLTRLVSPAA